MSLGFQKFISEVFMNGKFPKILSSENFPLYGKSQHETILADLNRYMTPTRLVIILTNDAIKHTCVWPLVWHNK